MRQYLNLLQDVLDNGVVKNDRTGVGTLSVFGRQARFSLAAGFPLLTTKKLHWKSIVHELLWFLRGDTNIAYLQSAGVSIWDEWADENGDMGPIYGRQWRAWPTDNGAIDQIYKVIDALRNNPDSRRIIVCAWNVGELPQMRLAPCHVLFQFYVANGKLSCQLYQRSADLFLGVPFNIASYALLTLMLAQVCGLQPGEFIHTFGDLHLYHNHRQQTQTQIARDLRPLPKLPLPDRWRTLTTLFLKILLLATTTHIPPLPRRWRYENLTHCRHRRKRRYWRQNFADTKRNAVASAGGLRPLQKTDLEQSNHHGAQNL